MMNEAQEKVWDGLKGQIRKILMQNAKLTESNKILEKELSEVKADRDYIRQALDQKGGVG
jgi:hypothetical protein